uniref:Uncharacterized protein n=1 Tax=Ficedula albicollis TaxID=59894 RepID=A0A803VGN5_FICAL
MAGKHFIWITPFKSTSQAAQARGAGSRSSNNTHTECLAATTVTQGPSGEGLFGLSPLSLSSVPSARHRGVGGEALLWEAPGGAPGCQRAGDRLPSGGLCDHAAGMWDAGGGGSEMWDAGGGGFLLEGGMQEEVGLRCGMQEEGLFRVAPSASKLKKLKAALDCCVVDVQEYSADPHAIAGGAPWAGVTPPGTPQGHPERDQWHQVQLKARNKWCSPGVDAGSDFVQLLLS